MSQDFAEISAEAKAFLAAVEPLPPAPTGLDELKVMRQLTLDGFRAAAEQVRDECVEHIEEVEFGGVRTWHLTPRDLPDDGANFTILYFYGGGFVQGSPFEDLPVMARVAHMTGAEVFAPWYRLSPEHPFPAPHEDALAVYRELVASRGTDSLAIMGESAGGNLTLSTLLNVKSEGLPFPVVAALLSPWSDLTTAPESLTSNDGSDCTINNSYTEFAANAYRGEAARADAGVSPIYGSYDETFPPTIITTGTRDLLLSHSVRQAAVMERAGIEVSLRVWEGMWHVFEFYPELPEATASLMEVSGFLSEKISARRQNV